MGKLQEESETDIKKLHLEPIDRFSKIWFPVFIDWGEKITKEAIEKMEAQEEQGKENKL